MSRMRWWKRYDQMPVVELQKSNPVRFGLVVIVIIAIAVYFGFTKHIPFKHGFRLKAVFGTALNISPKSPVRIAGVNVGTVTSVKREGNAGVVTMEISKGGLPIHRDATLKISARILLEGNWFVDLQPGTPTSPTVSSGYTIPITQTSDPVQIDQILDALNTDTRANLQTLLVEYGSALTRKPTPAENAEQNPAVRGLNAAQALKKTYYDSPQALKGGSDRQPGARWRRTERPLQTDLRRRTSSSPRSTATNSNSANGSTTSTPSSAPSPPSPRVWPTRWRCCRARSTTPRAHSPTSTPPRPRSASSRSTSSPESNRIQRRFRPLSRGSNRRRPLLLPTELGGVAKGLREAAPDDRQPDRASARLLQTGRPVLQVSEQDLLPGRQHQVAGRRQARQAWKPTRSSGTRWSASAGMGQSFDGNGQTTRFLVETGDQTLRSAPATVVGSPTRGKKLPLLAHTSQAPLGTSPAFPASEPPV